MALIALLLSAAVVAVDQILKLVVVEYLKPVGTVTLLNGLLNFRYIENRGAAFSILQNQRWFFVAITLAVCALIIYSLFRYKGHEIFSYMASFLIVGGGIGNLVDRVLHGYVVDYIQLSFFPAIFNFGDICVTVGTAFLVIHVLAFADRENRSEKVLRTK